MTPAETARCSDCYTVMFADEMNQCPEGHFTCPGCICDCVVVHAHVGLPTWLHPQAESWEPESPLMSS